MSQPDSIGALEAQLNQRREDLARDLEDLGWRLAPQTLKREAKGKAVQAGERVREAALDTKDRAIEAAWELRERAQAYLRAHVEGASGQACPVRHPGAALCEGYRHARAGEPGPLLAATGAVAGLAGVSLWAIRKAWRA